MRKIAVLLLPVILLCISCNSPGIKEDEELIFFPSYGYIAQKGMVNLEIHGHIYEPEPDSIIRNHLLEGLREIVGLEKTDNEYTFFENRSRLFMVDNERNKVISIRLGNSTHKLNKSGANGHIITIIPVKLEDLPKSTEPNGIISFQAVKPGVDNRIFKGQVQVIEPEGISIISDIDDTIKISHVLDKKELLRNTFFRSYRPVPGMNTLYQQWASKGAVFHYVSGSPWQLYKPISDFMQKNSFPEGSFHLKYFRLKDKSLIKFLIADQETYKVEQLQNIMGRFLQRRFILVGDSGEKDPEIYARIANQYPQQVQAICIRNVGDMNAQKGRFTSLKKKAGSVPWYFFNNGDDLAETVFPVT